MGGARRDEERARAKERIFSFRDDFGQWNPRAQRPELWNLYNARIRKGEHIRGFRISNWMELDVWQYIARENLELPRLCSARERAPFRRAGRLPACSHGPQPPPIEDASRRRGHECVDLALLTDGRRAEREQGITIDVAYRSFVTPRRRFQLADAPGHVQYTRNMVTGASTADVAVVLVDARRGVVEQTRRHSYIVSMLELPPVVYTVNKMDR